MNFHLTAEQKMMQELVRDFAQNEIAPTVAEMEKHQFPYEVIKKMGELGLMGIPIPEKYGGSGMDFMSYIIAIHEISKVSPALGVILSVHTSVGTNPIVDFGTEQQKSIYLPKLSSGKYLGAFALTEPQAGSDAASIRLRVQDEGAYYVLHGSKMFITTGLEADTFITVGNVGRIGIAAQALGIAEGALEHTINYAKEREQFGKPIANHQAIAFKLADMKTEVEAAKLLVYRAADYIQKEIPCIKEVSMAKLF